MSTYLRPVQSDPFWRARLVIARLQHLWPWLGAGGIIQSLLFSGRDLTLAKDTACTDALIATSAAFGPVPNHPAGDREKSKDGKGVKQTSPQAASSLGTAAEDCDLGGAEGRISPSSIPAPSTCGTHAGAHGSVLHGLCRSSILVSGLQKWLETVELSESFLHTTDWIWLPAERRRQWGETKAED